MDPGTTTALAPDPPLRPPAHRVSTRAVRWWRLRALVALPVLVLPQVVVFLLFRATPTWLLVTAAATAALVLAYAVVVPPLQYRVHRWEVTGEAVYTLSGWLVREWRIAPISRVQTVDTEAGPLQQWLRLGTVTVTTASARGPVRISGLDAAAAAELARSLTATTSTTPGDAT